VKQIKKFIFDWPVIPVTDHGGVGASSSKAPTAVTKKGKTSIKNRWIQQLSMIGVASSVELQELSPHNPCPKVWSKQLRLLQSEMWLPLPLTLRHRCPLWFCCPLWLPPMVAGLRPHSPLQLPLLVSYFSLVYYEFSIMKHAMF
jgi:hypothetical protein